MLTLMYITNDPTIALIAEKNGVERIWIDLESLGKEERQKGMNSVKSHHSIKDIEIISNLLTSSELLVRINPWNCNSKSEIEQVIDSGADMIMLPMWKSVDEVRRFLDVVNGRVKTTLLLETKEAEQCLESVLELAGIDEIHIGLNDLHLSYGLDFMFQLLSNGTVERICKKIKTKKIPYGFGGIAKLGEGMLAAEKIITEHYRLGSSRAILSRSFCDISKIQDYSEFEKQFTENMRQLREFERSLVSVDESVFEKNQKNVCSSVEKIVCALKEKENAKIVS